MTTRPQLESERALEIRGIPLASPFTLAALSGYSDMGMRVVCRRLGACLTRNEVVLDQFILQRGKGGRSGRHLDADDHPIACQLMGHDPRMMAEAAPRMVAYGYDLIDINFGCPVKKVLGRCRGGYLLSTPDTAIEMVQRVRDAVSVPLTLKMRRGSDDSPEAEEHFWRILEQAVQSGIAALTLHGRTVKQGYIGPSSWEFLRRVKDRYPALPIFGSGDLYTAWDCHAMMEQTKVDAVAIARGAIRNPWIFRDCLALSRGEPIPPAPSVEEQGDLFDQQLAYSIEQYGEERASRQLRKFAIKRAWLHPLASDVHHAMVRLKSAEEWRRVRRQFFCSEMNGLGPTNYPIPPDIGDLVEEGA